VNNTFGDFIGIIFRKSHRANQRKLFPDKTDHEYTKSQDKYPFPYVSREQHYDTGGNPQECIPVTGKEKQERNILFIPLVQQKTEENIYFLALLFKKVVLNRTPP